MHPLVYYISQSTTDENNKALAARPGISSMERCPSGLRCMIGNHVDGEYRHGGSNPPLSATKARAHRRRWALLLCHFYTTKNNFSCHFYDTCMTLCFLTR